MRRSHSFAPRAYRVPATEPPVSPNPAPMATTLMRSLSFSRAPTEAKPATEAQNQHAGEQAMAVREEASALEPAQSEGGVQLSPTVPKEEPQGEAAQTPTTSGAANLTRVGSPATGQAAGSTLPSPLPIAAGPPAKADGGVESHAATAGAGSVGLPAMTTQYLPPADSGCTIFTSGSARLC